MTILGLVACGALVTAATASGGGKADTQVTIKSEGGDPVGTVKSSNEHDCADDRLVKIYREKGGEQGGGDDVYTGSQDTTSFSNGKYRWSVGQPGLEGKHYARAPGTSKCKADNSKTIVSATRSTPEAVRSAARWRPRSRLADTSALPSTPFVRI